MTDTLAPGVLIEPRRGRPRACKQYSTVTAHVPADLHDALIQLAGRKEMSVSSVVREIVSRAIVLQNK